jgi:choline-sulfatase
MAGGDEEVGKKGFLMTRPNILLFVTDDHAQWALGAYGNREIHAPTLDYLAKTGVRMANAFTPTPVCSPARACLLTGRLASQHGLHDYLASTDPEVDGVDWLGDEIMLGQLLQEAGYQTGYSGKWHLGRDEHPQPGYDSWFTLGRGYPILHQGPHAYGENGEHVTIAGRPTQVITDRAVDFLRGVGEERPFFLTVGYYATHSPWRDHPPRLVSQYADCTFDDIPADEMHPFGRQNLESTDPTRDDPRAALAQYYAAVSEIDEGVGRIVDELAGSGLLDNTLIIYTADHGLNCGHHGIWGKGNGTLPLNMVEESIRVPLILWQRGMATAVKSAANLSTTSISSKPFSTPPTCRRRHETIPVAPSGPLRRIAICLIGVRRSSANTAPCA